MTKPTLQSRSSGVLLPIASLAGSAYAGDLGDGAYAFVDFLKAAGQSWWQMLPVHPIGAGNSGYASVSSFAGETLYLDLQPLVEAGWLRKRDLLPRPPDNGRRVDYVRAATYRGELLLKAFASARPELAGDADFAAFQSAEAGWLTDYTRFIAYGSKFAAAASWAEWPEPVRQRAPEALAALDAELAERLLYVAFGQWLFARQWQRLKAYANDAGIGLIGDLPIFVAHDSADVWAHQPLFQLGDDHLPTVVAGCPPDAFSKDGQMWGNALYDWSALQADHFGWWLARLRRSMQLFDAIRLDHFIGFHRYWAIPAAATNARGGTWRPVPGDAFFAAVQKEFGHAPLIAEDLGAVTPEVRALRDRFGFPGMRVLQFGFDGSSEAAQHQAHRLPPHAVVYTGTHDNDTTRGWYAKLQLAAGRDKRAKAELARVQAYLGASEAEASWALIRAAMASPANVAVVPMQDLLNKGSKARMNVPGVARGNWEYRVTAAELSKGLREQLAATTLAFDRAAP